MELTFVRNAELDAFIKDEFYRLRPSMYIGRDEDFRTFLVGKDEKLVFKNNFKQRFGFNKTPNLEVMNNTLKENGTSLRIVSRREWIIDCYLQVWRVMVETKELGLFNVVL